MAQTKDAVAQLQDQIETIRREAYEEGYSAAMRAVVEFTTGTAKTAPTNQAPRRTRSQPAPAPASREPPSKAPRRKTSRIASAKRVPRSRGNNARHIAGALTTLPDRTGPAAAIRKALAEKGINLAYTSIRHALGQLQARGQATVADDGKTWTYTAAQAG